MSFRIPDEHLSAPPDRISVVGNTGSGKTTLAAELAEILDCPHIEMDALHWGPNWTLPPVDIFRDKVRQATAGERWVIDGNYSRVRDIINERLQILVWLDYPLFVNMWRLTRRGLYRTITQEVLWESGNRESFRGQFLSRDSLYVWAFKSHHIRRERYQAYMNDPDYAHIRFVRLRSPLATNRWKRQLEDVCAG